MSRPKKILLFVALLSLAGTVTNYVYLSPLLTLFFPLALFVVHKKTLQRPILWLYVYLVVFLIATVMYDWHALFRFGFYRRDGNFIIAYAPLFVLPLFRFQFDLKKWLRYFYLFVLVLYGLLFVYHLYTFKSFSNYGWSFSGLFLAKNAVGGFLAVMASMGFAYFYHRRDKKEFIYFIIIFVMMLATYSRGAALGFLLALAAWQLSITRRFKWLLGLIALPVLLTAGCLYLGYPQYKNTVQLQDQAVRNVPTGASSKVANVILRINGTFPRAFYLFLNSPLVGTGVGSYNDRPIKLKKVVPLVSYNAQPHKTFSDATAHHSYLNILGEEGILGLGLFLAFWVSLFWYLMKTRGAPMIRDFLIITFFVQIFVAFTGHRLTTPSNMLPFTIIIGLFMACDEPVQTYFIKKAQTA